MHSFQLHSKKSKFQLLQDHKCIFHINEQIMRVFSFIHFILIIFDLRLEYLNIERVEKLFLNMFIVKY